MKRRHDARLNFTGWRAAIFASAALLLACAGLLFFSSSALADPASACEQEPKSLGEGVVNAIFNEPVVNQDGTRTAFWATYADPLLGDNSDGSIELFIANTDAVTPTNSYIDHQVTESRGNILGGFNIMPDMITYNDQNNARHTLIVFASDRDLVGANPDGGFEIFLAQTEPTRWIVQLTDTRRSASILPTMSNVLADGTLRVLFLSDADDREIMPSAVNPDRNQEVFLATVALNNAQSQITSILQVTQTDVDVINDQPVIGGFGDHLAFVSTARTSLRSGAVVDNSDGNREIIFGHIENGAARLIQATKTTNGENSAPVLNQAGHRMAFVSSAAGLPNAPQQGSAASGFVDQVISARINDSTAPIFNSLSAGLRPPTGATGSAVAAREPSISSDGQRILFVAEGCVPGIASCNIAPGSAQVIIADENLLRPGNFFFSQATGFGGDQASSVHQRPAVSGDGRSFAVVRQPFLGRANLDYYVCPASRVILEKSFAVNSVVNDPAVDPLRPDVGDQVLYDVTIRNNSTTPFGATLAVTDTLPPASQVIYGTPVIVDGANAVNVLPVRNGSTLSWQVKDIDPQSAVTVRMPVTIRAGMSAQTIVNSVVMTERVASPAGSALIENLETSATLKVTQVDVSAALAVSTQLPREGQNFDYTITVNNAGPDPATTIKVIDTAPLSGDFTLVSATPASGVYNSANHTWTIPVLAANQSTTLRLTVRPNIGAGGKPPVTAALTSLTFDQEDSNLGNNITVGSQTIRVLGTDLQIVSKSVAPAASVRNPAQGEIVTFTLVFKNNGPLSNSAGLPNDALYVSNAAAFVPATVAITDVLPAGLSFVSASDGGSISGGVVNWQVPGWSAGTTKTLTLRARVDAPGGTVITNRIGAIRAAFANDQTMNDPVPANNQPNTQGVPFTVNSPAQVSLTLTPASITEARRVTATVVYTDPDNLDNFTIVVNWGDGTATSQQSSGNAQDILTFTHVYADDDADDSYTVTATVTDSTNQSNQAVRTVTVTNVAPTVQQPTVTGFVRQLANDHYLATTSNTLQVRTDFSDPGFTRSPSVESFTYQVNWGDGVTDSGAVANVTNGSFGVATTGRFTLTHRYNGLGVFPATVIVRDDDGGQNQRNFTVTVNNVPTAHDDAVSVNEDSAVVGNMLANDRPDGDAFPDTTDILTVTQVITAGTKGVLVGYNPTGAFTYSTAGKFESLALGQSAADSFTYMVRDLFAFISSATVNVTVIGVNDAPVLTLNATSRPFVEDMGNTQLTPSLIISDVDSGALISRALITLTNPLDGAAESLFPTGAPAGSISVGYNPTTGVLTLSGNASLAAYQTLLRSVVYTNTDDTPSIANRTLRFTVFDEHNAPSSLRTLTVTVQDKNDAPIVTLLPFTPTEDISLSIGNRIQVVDVDAVADSLRLTATVTHGNLTLPGATGSGSRQVVLTAGLATLNSLNLTYLGDPDYTGPDSLTVTVNDLGHNPSGPLSNTKTQPFFVASVDDAPRVAPLSVTPVTMNENTLVTVTVAYTDPDVGESQTIVVNWGDGTLPSQRNHSALNASFTFTHTYADDNPADRYTILATVTDSATPPLSGSASRQVTVTNVLPTLDPLTLTGTAKQTIPNKDVVATTLTPLVVRGTFSDPGFTLPPGKEVFSTTVNWGDGSIETLPVVATVNGKLGVATTGVFTRSHQYTVYGFYTATVTVFDDDDPTGDTETFRVTVSDLPATNDDFFALDENSIIGGNVLDNDGKSGPDDDLDIQSINTVGTVGLVSNVITETGAFSYTAAGRFEQLKLNELAADSFRYTAINKVGFTSTAVANVTVIGVNDAPVLTLNAVTQAFREDTGNTQLTPTLTITDIDNGALISRALITLTNPLDGAAEALIATGSPGFISVGYNSTTGVLTLSGNASLSAYQTLLRSVVYTNTDDTPSLMPRTLRFTVFDEYDAPSTLRTLTVTVQDKNDAPIVTLLPLTPTEDISLSIGNRIQVVDVDAVADSLRLTATVTHGNLTLPGATGSGSRQVVLTAGLAALNSLNLTYLGDADYTGPDALTVTVNDLGHNPFGPLSHTQTRPFFVTPVDDNPRVTLVSVVPSTMNENTLVTATVNYIDPDAGETRTVVVDWGDGTAASTSTSSSTSASKVFTHTYADDNPADRYTILATVTDSATPPLSGSDSRQVTVTNVLPTLAPLTLTGTAKQTIPNKDVVATTSVPLVVRGTFSDPGFTLPPGEEVFFTTVNWGDGLVETRSVVAPVNGKLGVATTGVFTRTHQYTVYGIYTATVTVFDDDDPTGDTEFFRVTVSDLPASGDDVFSLDEDSVISGNVLDNDGKSGPDDDLDIQSINTAGTVGLVSNVIFETGAFSYTAAGRFEPLEQGELQLDVFRYTAINKVGFTNTATVNITVIGVNDAPVLTLNATSRPFVEDMGNTQLTPALTIADVDNDALISRALVTITNPLDGAAEALFPTGAPGSISVGYNPTTGVLTLSGNASLAAYQTLLRSVVYTNTDDTPSIANRTLRFTVFDEYDAPSTLRTLTVTVQDKNDAPIVTLLPFTPTEDISLSIGNRIQVVDVDAVADSLRLTATVTHGNLTLPDATGSGSRQVVLTAGLATLNSLNLTYLGDPDYTGSDSLTVTVNDLGHNPSGPLSNTKTQPFFVASVDDAPRVNLVSVVPNIMNENTLVTAQVSYFDPDASETRTVVVNWGDGTATSTAISTQLNASFTFTHTYADDNPADRYTILATVTDSATPPLSGSDSRQVTVTNVLPTLAPLTLTGTAKQTIPNKDVVATTSAPLVVRGTFSDPGFTLPPGKEVFSTTVNWGDGSIETLPVVATVNGKLGVATTGVFTRSHQYTVYGFYTATVTVFDDDDPTGDTESFRVTVSDLPASGDDFFTLNEDSVIGGNVLDNDGKSGPDDDLDIQSVNTVGTVGLVSNVITETGAFSYTAAGRFEALALGQQQLDVFRYTAVNKVGFTNTATVQITVIGVNDAPVLTLNATSRPFVEDMGNTQLTPALTIADVDNGALISRALITITNPLDGAAEALFPTGAPGSISVGYNSTTGVLTLSGNASLTAYQTLLRSVVYTNTDDTPSIANRTLRFTVFDEYDAPSTLRTLTVTVQDKNDAPIVTLLPFTPTEDISLSIGNRIQVVDVDAVADSLRLTATVTHGNLTLPGATGSGSRQVVLTAGLATLNSLNLTYLGDPDYTGPDSLTVTVNDLGHNPSGPLSNTKTQPFFVTAVNDAPVLSSISPAVTFVENLPPVTVAANVTIVDVDSANMLSATVTLATTPDGAEEVLAATVSGGMSASYNPASRTLTLSGSATRSAYQSALRSVTYSNSDDTPTTTPRTLSFVVYDDLGAASNTSLQTVNIQATNDNPVISLSPGSTNAEEGGPAVIVDAAMTVSDPDTPILANGRFTVTVVSGAANSDFLNIAASGPITRSGNQLYYLGVHFGVATGLGETTVTVALNGNASTVAVQALARSMTYQRDNKGKPPASVNITFRVSDGVGGVSNLATKIVSLGSTNDAPEVAIGPISATEDTLFTIGASVAITDFDADTGTMLLTATVNSGVLTATGDSDSNPRRVVIAATLAVLKTRLSAMTYQGDLNFNGNDTLTVTLNDQGNTGSGGAQSDSDARVFTVAAVNDPPTVQITTVSATEDTPLNIRPNIVISDPDSAANSLRITMTVASGTLTPSGGGLTTVSGSGTGVLVVTGSLAQFAGATITYAPALNVNGAVALSVTVNDQGAIGTGGAKSASDSGVITIAAVNDAPTVAVDIIGIAEETTTNIRPNIVISDVDVASGSLRITMTVASGTLNAVGFTPVSGNGTTTLVILRTLAQFATSTINYTPPANFVGSAALTVTANDQGATGSGGAKSASDSGSITVAGVNDAPTVTVADFGATEDTPLNIRPNIVISDVDAGASSLRITITVASGSLTPSGGGLTTVSGSGTGVLVVTGSLAQFAGATITYAPALNVNGAVALSVTVNDQGAIGTGGAKSASDSGVITIAAVNDAPTVAVDTIGIAEETTTNIRPNIVISDVDVASGSLRITMTVASGTLNAVGFTPVSGNGTTTLVILRALAQFATSTINYTPPANFVGSAALTVTVNDQGATGSGGAKSASDSGSITVAGVNDAPTVTVADFSATEDTPLNIRPNIVISDVDAGASSLRITMTVASGTLTPSGGGLTTVSGSGTGVLVVTGSLAQFAGATITYAPALNVNGAVALSVTVNDQGAIGTGGAKSASDSGVITIAAVNDAPTVSIGAISVSEDVATNIRSSITISDVDVAASNLRITMTVASGTLTPSGGGLTIISGNGTGTVVVTGSLVQFGASTINYTSAANASGSAALTVAVNDQGATGSGGAKSASANGTINITAVNDAPTVQISTVSATEDTSLNIRPNIVISDVDAGGATLRITITVASGTLTQTGLTLVSGSGTGVLVVTGSLTQFAGATITYAPALNVNGAVALSVAVNDQGASGAGGAQTTSANGSINISAVNDAPTLVINPFSVGEDSTTNIRPFITLADVDAGSSSLAFTMTVTNGTLQVSGLTVVSGNGTGVVVATGSLGIFNVSIINYTPALDYIGNVELTVAVSDQGATGVGGSLTASDIRIFNVSDVNDPPVLDLNGPSGGVGFNAAFVEDQGPVSITANSLTLVDPDSTTMFSATVRISNLLDGASEVLSADTVGFVTPSYSAGVLTLTGPDNRENFEAALRTVKYNNNSQNPTTTTRAVVFVVKDAGGNMSTPVSAAVTVARTNDTPTLLLPSGTLTVTEGASAQQLDAAAQVSDVDSTAFASGGVFTVTVQSVTVDPVSDARDKLSIGAFGNITVSGGNVFFSGANIGAHSGLDKATLKVTLNNGVTLAQVQALARAFTYRQTVGPDIPSRNVLFELKETGAVGAALAYKNVVIVSIPPQLTLNATAANYSEDSAAVAFAPNLTLVDSDSTNMVSATVQIDNLLDAGKETLAATLIGGITQSYNSATGVLTLSGSSSKANYQTVLRSVTYINSSQNPNTTARVLRFLITDDQSSISTPVTGTLAIVAVNDTPTVTVNPVAATEDTALNIRPSITISDVDVVANNLRITVTVNSGVLTASSPGAVSGGGTGVLVVTSNLTQFAASVITFTPTANMNGGVNLTVTANDQGATGSGGAKTGSNNATITVAAVNDTPTVLLPSGTLTVTEDGPAAQLDAAAQVSDVDSTVFASGGVFTVTVQSVTVHPVSDARDKLSIGAFGNITVSGSNVLFSGGNIGTHSGLDKATLKVTLNNGVTLAQVQALARAFTYRQEKGPDIPSRTVLFELKENGASGQGIAVKSVTILSSNPPEIGLGATAASYTEGAAAVTVAPVLVITDTDSSNMSSATVQIDNLLNAGAETLSATGTVQITPSYNPATGVLTLSGNSNKNNYQTVLRSVTYINTSQSPNTTPRVLRFTVTDNQSLTSAPVTATLAVIGVNDAPTVSFNAINAVEDTPLNIRPSIVISDVDASGASVRITVTVNSGVLQSTLPGATGNGTPQVAATATLTAFGSAALDYTPPTNYAGSVNLTVAVSDLGATPPPAQVVSNTTSFTVAAVNDPPTVIVNTVVATEDTPSDIRPRIIISDVDAGAASLRITVTVGSGALTANGLAVVSGSGTSTLTVTATVAGFATSVITYTPPVDASGPVALKVVANDQGATGSGGPLNGSGSNTINIAPVDDSPVLALNTGITATNPLTTGVVTVTLPMTTLEYTDVDTPASGIVYTVTAVPMTGTVLLNSSPLAANSTFTQDDVDNNRLKYRFNAATPQPFTVSFKFRVRGEVGPPERTYLIRIE